jgi:hypothetical protein
MSTGTSPPPAHQRSGRRIFETTFETTGMSDPARPRHNRFVALTPTTSEGSQMTDRLEPAFSIPTGFKIHEVRPRVGEAPESFAPAAPEAPPPLGPLAAFVGTWTGIGFNTIFRPQNKTFPLPIPAPGDNILELNLTTETLSFSPSLGSVPNRGTLQDDIFLNGVPYVQSISDVTNPAPPTGIHFEPGIWLSVPATTNPSEPLSIARMASIPHGTTIVAQGVVRPAKAGPPDIHAVDITPFPIKGGGKIRFPSQTAAAQGTARIPQDLTPWIKAGTITQELLDDPNRLLRNAIAVQKILSTTTMIVSTNPASPLFGGGTDNIAFLLGDPAGANANANTVTLDAIFWIETVEHQLHIDFPNGSAPTTVRPRGAPFGLPVPSFLLDPPIQLTGPRIIKVNSIQIQYSQTVMLNFKGLSWPHVSVATLVPADPLPIPASAWT